MHTKRFNTFFKRWVQFRVGAIPRHERERKNYTNKGAYVINNRS